VSVYTHSLPGALPQAVRHLGWFALFCAVAFLVPYLSVTVLSLQHDAFYLAYFAVTIALVSAYIAVERVAVADVFLLRWRWSIGIGAILAALLVFNVFSTEDATAHPRGAYFVFELLWRGVGYGLIDTLLLTVVPCLVAYQLLRGHIDGLKGKLRFTALALPLVILVTATYHLGYPQYRQDGLSRPETGNVLISIPTFATANPVGSVVAHVSQHVAAVTHAYESRIFNPPVTKS
jgi:hypothetical protein